MKVWIDGDDDEFCELVEVGVERGDRVWVEKSETSDHVVLGLEAEVRYAVGGTSVHIAFESIEAMQGWLTKVVTEFKLEAWVEAAPR